MVKGKSTTEFEWSDVANDTVVESVSAIAVYINPKGAIVIRQQGEYAVSDDQVVIVPQIHLSKLIAKLIELQSDLEVLE